MNPDSHRTRTNSRGPVSRTACEVNSINLRRRVHTVDLARDMRDGLI